MNEEIFKIVLFFKNLSKRSFLLLLNKMANFFFFLE
jgi:hypothetical protein